PAGALANRHTSQWISPRDTPADGYGRASAPGLGGSAGGCGVLLLLDEFALDRDLDFLADDEPAVQDRVETQAELLPVDLGVGAVRDPVPHHSGVVELAVLRHFEGDRAGVALDGQVAGQRVVVRVDRPDAGALERDERVLVHLEEVGRADVVV